MALENLVLYAFFRFAQPLAGVRRLQATPLTVKAALRKVDGVIEVQARWEPKEAVVTYDDTGTDLQALTETTRDAGYPATAERQP